MFKFLATSFLIVVMAGPLAAQSSDIRATIEAQIEAFEEDDFERAFTFASPTIRDLFRTHENFGAMVRGGYPMVWRPSDLRFLELREIAGSHWQKVLITDQQGKVHVLDYQMIEVENGWNINAVQLLEANDVNALNEVGNTHRDGGVRAA